MLEKLPIVFNVFSTFRGRSGKTGNRFGEAHPYTLCFRGLSDVLRMIDGLILTEDLLRKRFRNFAPYSKLHFYSSDYLLH